MDVSGRAGSQAKQRSYTMIFTLTRFQIVGRLVESSRCRQALSAERILLDGDAIASLIAGSDTTSCLLTYILAHLAETPTYQDQVLNELSAHQIKDPWETKALQNLPFLNALVNESLRLHNPGNTHLGFICPSFMCSPESVPTGTPRDTGSEGITIGGRSIPPHTIVVAPRWNIARCKY